MYDHDHCHDQSQDMHKVVRRLEDEGIRNLNRSRIAQGLYAHAIVDVLVAHDGAERYRRLFAYRLEVAKGHVRLVVGEVGVTRG
jgi:hypothetical protein